MKRFYDRGIKALKEKRLDELADDINDYVNYLEHEKSALISELALANTFTGDCLLVRLGFKVKAEAESDG